MQKITLNHYLITLAAGVLSLQFSVAQASSCKVLAQDACSSNQACTWVKGYQRKDGRAVQSYCRTLPAKNTVELPKQGNKAKS